MLMKIEDASRIELKSETFRDEQRRPKLDGLSSQMKRWRHQSINSEGSELARLRNRIDTGKRVFAK